MSALCQKQTFLDSCIRLSLSSQGVLSARNIAGDDTRIFPHTDEQGGLSLPKEVNAHEVQPRYDPTRAIDLEWKPGIIKGVGPWEPGLDVRSKTACENHRSEVGQVNLHWPATDERAGLRDLDWFQAAFSHQASKQVHQLPMTGVTPRDCLLQIGCEPCS